MILHPFRYSWENYMVDTTSTIASNSPVSDLSEAGAPEIEVTPAMIAAGATVLGEAYDRPYDRSDLYSYEPFVAGQVFRAMAALMGAKLRV